MAPTCDAREDGCMHLFRMRAMQTPPNLSRLLLAGATVLLAACQSLPAEEVSRARAMVAGATLSSIAHPAAPEVARSQRKVALAQRWIDAGDYRPARWLAEQAEVDAELALARRASEQARLTLAARERAGATRVSWRKP